MNTCSMNDAAKAAREKTLFKVAVGRFIKGARLAAIRGSCLMSSTKFIFLSFFALGCFTSSIVATPSTQIWNPSTDIQAVRTMHLGIDDYFSVVDNKTKPYSLLTDVNFTYGLIKNLEVGVDIFEPSTDPLQFNAKYGIPEGDVRPAIAVGGMNFGTKKTENDSTGTQINGTDYNILYGVIAKTFKPVGRFSLGYYSGNDKLLVDETGAKANTGMIATWDKQITDKVWTCIDYASGKSFYGNTSVGFSYAFAPNTSVIFAYVFYNNTDPAINRNNQVTTQLDINF